MAGHTHTLALQDISLKSPVRFRLRYSTASDCYYLHWDQTVCPPLARITGLATGATNVTGLTRYTDQESKMSYLGLSDGAMEGEIEWTLDFSHSGLAVKKMLLKAGSVAGEEEGTQITHVLTGDGKRVANSSHYGSRTAEVYQMCGHSVVSIRTILSRTSKDAVLHFLPEGDGDVCPLDVTVELMVPRNADVYIGEILLGLNEDTHQPFNAFVQCAVLPESEHSCSPKQTSPRHNVYPTWTKEFVFPGLSRATLSEGGLEVILYDHHRLHRVNIGGIRLCVPRLKEPSPVLTQKSFQRDGSVILFGQAMKDGAAPHSSHGASKPGLPPISPLVNFSPSSNSPLLQRRDLSIPKLASSSPQLSPRVSPRNSTSASPLASPLSSPWTSPKNSPRSSPFSSRKSPVAFLKNLPFLSSSRSTSPVNDTDYLCWWMDSTLTEVQHWRDMLGREREWVYCWHLLRPKLQPASTT
ncbi:hypothetical protein EMCRGX_G029993 [Ephydatia muelleri]